MGTPPRPMGTRRSQSFSGTTPRDRQKLNATAFTTGGIAGTAPDVVGEPHTDEVVRGAIGHP